MFEQKAACHHRQQIELASARSRRGSARACPLSLNGAVSAATVLAIYYSTSTWLGGGHEPRVGGHGASFRTQRMSRVDTGRPRFYGRARRIAQIETHGGCSPISPPVKIGRTMNRGTEMFAPARVLSVCLLRKSRTLAADFHFIKQ